MLDFSANIEMLYRSFIWEKNVYRRDEWNKAHVYFKLIFFLLFHFLIVSE